jgi:hypothetical protein
MDATDAVLMPPPPTCPYGVRPRGQTPIYDQLRGERVNVDVSTTGPDPQRVDHRGNHRLLTDAQVPAVVFGPPGPGADLAAGSPPAPPAASHYAAAPGAAAGDHGAHPDRDGDRGR